MLSHEKVKYWRDLNLPHLELLRATYITQTFAPHAHEGFAIGVVSRGVATTSYRRQQYEIPAGAVIVINPGEIHTGAPGSEQGWSYRMFYPTAAAMQHLASDLAGCPRDVPFFPIPVIFDDYLAYLLASIHLTFEAQGSPLLERESLFWWVMAYLVMTYADAPLSLPAVQPERRCVARVKDYIETNYADDISLTELSELVHFNACHLLRLFSKTVGVPPHAYLNQVRIRRAKHLLNGGCSIADAACQTGFSDQSHLTRHFKRVYGITPGQYILSLN
ncbi:MAG: AraC family transcriptional regulator [Anaerolineae bacterium]